jgi:hypothetical protein
MAALIYHGTPITPNEVIPALGTRAYCISYARPDQLVILLGVAPWLMIDNGAFSAFTKGRAVDWPEFYRWLEPILFSPGRWAVIPDVIDAGSQLQDALLGEWPFGHRGAPVWHMDEPTDRLARLCAEWPRVCIGSTGEYWQVGADDWKRRMDEAWPATNGAAIHMLRGTAVAGLYPFDSADSSSLGKNGWRYDSPMDGLFGTPWRGRIAYADRLERYAA